MSAMLPSARQSPYGGFERVGRKVRERGARHMVMQGLALYYQSLIHRVVDDTAAYFDHVVQRASRSRSDRPG